MARPKGSRNRPKGDDAQAPAAIGHNTATSLSLDDQKILLNQHCGVLEDLIEKQKSIVSSIRTERKRAKASGFDRVEIDFALRLRASQDHGEDKRNWERLQFVALCVNHPIGTQPDMFAVADEATALIAKAKADGKQAGLEGDTAKSPHHPGTPQDQAWLEGHHEGRAALASQIGRGNGEGSHPVQ